MQIKDNLLIFDKSELKIKKKIPARVFAGLNHFDKFNSPEEYLLEHHGLVTSDDIDPKYKARGDLAERIVKQVYQRNHQIVTYDAEKMHWDAFPDIPIWGGVPDIELPLDDTIVEVKSKSMSHYDYITKYPLQSEIHQGLFYAYHRGYSKCIMEWIFFDEQTDSEISQGLPPTTLKNIKRFSKEYDVDRPYIKGLLDNAKAIVDEFRSNPILDIHNITPRILKKVIDKAKGVNNNVQK